MLVIKTVLREKTIPAPRINNPIVEVPIAEPPPNRISMIKNKTFFFFEFLYIF